MPNFRADRINNEIKSAVADILPTLKDPRIQGLVSVTRADVAADLKTAKIYVSILAEADVSKDIMRGLRSAAGFVRRELGSRVEIRALPELTFILDDSIVKGSQTIDLLKSLDIKHDE